MVRRVSVALISLALMATGTTTMVSAQESDPPDRPLPDRLAGLRLDEPSTATQAEVQDKLDPQLRHADGTQLVSIELSEEPVASAAAAGADSTEQQAQQTRVERQQQDVLGELVAADRAADEVASVSTALNAIMVEADADALAELATDERVLSIARVIDYEMDLSETVPYIGAETVQNAGFDGTGVRVAVLDSGVDYTHANLGGDGTAEAYEAAYGTDPGDARNKQRDGLFPTDKVVEGYDFVGEQWVGGDPPSALSPDDDPIDYDGHGTHVGDIIGGEQGVAPGADLYAAKVCASQDSACSGIALMLAMDWVLDPHGTGEADPVDIVNLSLGATYGQHFDNQLSQAVENVSHLDVLVVASSGNSSDKPFITGTPAAAPSALSVAQTHVPSDILPVLEVLDPEAISGEYGAVFQPWSAPLESVIEAPLQYGDGAGGNLLGCEPFEPGSLDGHVVLVDRGDCNFSLKISHISQAGGLAGIIGLVTPEAPFTGGDGGDRPIDVPGFMIGPDENAALKTHVTDGVTVRFDPEQGAPLVGHVVGSSSRGPTMLSNRIKPEIGAPGASVSAIAGGGTEEGPFGGTSGAAPMVTGSAALLMQALPERDAMHVKAGLMNTAETEIQNAPELLGGGLAPIARIGGGEVRVDRALDAGAVAWVPEQRSAALSFGFHEVAQRTTTLTETVRVSNVSDRRITYDVDASFRFADDEANGAVSVNAPSRIAVAPGKSREVKVTIEIDGAKLPSWDLDSGGLGADGDAITAMEYDGYVTFTEAGQEQNTLRVPWHVLPRQSGDVRETKIRDEFRLTNTGVGDAPVEAYSLVATSEQLERGGPGEESPTPDLRYVGVATSPVPAGFCSDEESFVMTLAVNTWERQTHANAPASFEFWLDTDQDGTDDYVVVNRDLSFSAFDDGRNATFVVDLASGDAQAWFLTDHDTNSANTVLPFCGEQIGMTAADFGDPMDVTAVASDVYFDGPGDATKQFSIAPLGERFVGVFHDGGVGFGTVPARGRETLGYVDGGPGPNTSETGLLLLYREGAPGMAEATALELTD
ncbi:S8 family serine peptidase [Phytoactinopolyspora halotolerans]|uniref:S8 family serine peptidase n=1 Tax=Phytoactinopolyspora halotolerans TaxID=1981512 RepID=A0A6L9SEV1_9ACTN|nr:S8 family serine peptidase [Phytoactinopolyspora halotolerans]NEE03021.1 S8 family serine peptidase [Phytoactinopolyspora halotolerans]